MKGIFMSYTEQSEENLINIIKDLSELTKNQATSIKLLRGELTSLKKLLGEKNAEIEAQNNTILDMQFQLYRTDHE